MSELTEPTAYILPAALRANLLQYLMSRPFAEVDGGVQAMLALQPLPEPEPDRADHA
jgi:hypothetical protein